MSFLAFKSTEPWFQESGVLKHEHVLPARVAVIGCLRLASKYALAYVRQLLNLQQNFQAIEIVVIVHDKPTEQTRPVLLELEKCGLPIMLLEESRADAGAETMSAKAWQWAGIANQAIEECLRADCTHVLWLESDLTFPLDLLDRLVGRNCDIVAPVVFLGGFFYDTWGFRDLDGNAITSVANVSKGVEPPLSLVEVGSSGSCVLFRVEIFREGVRFRGEHENGLLVGVCQDARKLGYRVWVDLATSVIHPTNLWREQVWVVDSLQAMTSDGNMLLDLQNANIPVASVFPDYLEGWLRQIPELANTAHYPWQSVKLKKDLEQRRLGVSIVADAKMQPAQKMSVQMRAKNAVRSLLSPFRS